MMKTGVSLPHSAVIPTLWPLQNYYKLLLFIEVTMLLLSFSQ